MRQAFNVRSLIITKPLGSSVAPLNIGRGLLVPSLARSRWPTSCGQGRTVTTGDSRPSRGHARPRIGKFSTRPKTSDSASNSRKSKAPTEDITTLANDVGKVVAEHEPFSTESRLENLRREGIAQVAERSEAEKSTTEKPTSEKPTTNEATHISSQEVRQNSAHSTSERSQPPPEEATTPSNDIHDTSLPSHTASNRSVIVARFHTRMERLLASLAIASQRVNTYTGTDYSGIASLRDRIISLEGLMKSRREIVVGAKEAHAAAVTAQSASQKEVVQLLERKHSWSAADLERYMALIRSEHVNEQAVAAANESVAAAERSLEETRAALEKFERRQYHEEQIWSDTIRRNSTWVTFGLMGVNILLLLVSLVLIEPWRRKRLVKEVRSVMDERAVLLGDAPAGNVVEVAPIGVTLPTQVPINVEGVVDAATPPTSESLEQVQETTVPTEAWLTDHPTLVTLTDAPPSIDLTSQNRASSHTPGTTTKSPALVAPPTFAFFAGTWTATFEVWKAYWADLFSERMIALRKVDLTASALEGAAAGAACMGLLLVLLRPQ